MKHLFTIACLLAGLAGEGLAGDDFKIEARFDGSKWLKRTDRIELESNRAMSGANERIVVFLGSTDVTPLFDISSTVIRYRPTALPLPSGEHQLVVHRVTAAGEWSELARSPIRILTAGGFEKATVTPSVDLSSAGQFDQHENPAPSTPSRGDYQDMALQGGLSGELGRGDFSVRMQSNLNGVNRRQQALRYAELGEEAPRIDLSNYRLEIQKGTTQLALGHVAYGSQRHLINGFGSRGAVLTFGVGRPVSFSLGAMNGTSIVGWDNVLGLQDQQHRVMSATIGLELWPRRPGAARLETSILHGSLLPLNRFSQGAIVSAESSRGGALRLTLTNQSQRLLFDAGFTRSQFEPAHDAELESGLGVVPLQERERDAAYLDATLVLIQNRKIGKTQSATLSWSANLERVEPLFRSVAAGAQPDVLRAMTSLNGSVGPLALQIGFMQSEDNLDDIRSILKTHTRESRANVGLNLASLFGVQRGTRWIPSLTATASRVHQYGAYLPVDSGFSASHVPDQVSTSAQSALEWQVGLVRFGYRSLLSDQDNRQPGRQLSDFKSGSDTLFLGLAAGERLDLTFESSLEKQRNLEFKESERTQRHGLNASWRFYRDLAMASNYSITRGRNGGRTSGRESSEGFFELSSGVRLWRSAVKQNQSRLFVRFSERNAESFDRLFDVRTDTEGWTLTSGVNLSVY